MNMLLSAIFKLTNIFNMNNVATASMAERLTRVPRMRKVWRSNPEPAKSYTALQTVCHRFNIYTSTCIALPL